MKKLVISVAVMAAASAASAQSSVTLFGVVDATFAVGRGSKSDVTRLTNSGNASSRLGFRGTEDLGGGRSASFWLEASVSNDDGRGAATNANNQASGGALAGIGGGQGVTFNRRSTVSLTDKWGELRLGRDYTPQFWNTALFDPFGYIGVGATQTTVNITGITTARASNTIGYLLPGNLGGFYGQAQVYLGENSSNTLTESDGGGVGVRLGYASGPVSVAIALGRTSYAAGDIRQNNIGGEWNFKVAKAMFHIASDRNGLVDGKGWLIGGVVPVGVGEIRTSYSGYQTNAAGNPETWKLALGYVHNLSKRTALYATYARVENDGGAAVGLNASVTAPNNSSSGMDFGLRHVF